MSGRGPAAVLLDMDGVQVDSEPCHERSFHLWVERRGVELPPDVDPEQFRGLDDRSIFEGLSRYVRLPASVDELILERGECFLEELAREDLRPMEGLVPLLESLAGAGVPMALCSSSIRSIVDGVIDKIGTRHYYDAILTGSDVERCKPAPDIYREAMRQLGAPPRECVAIEDSAAGLEAALGAGSRAVLLLHPTYLAHNQQDAHMTTESLASLTLPVLRQLVDSG